MKHFPYSVNVTVAKQPERWTTPLKLCVDWMEVYFKDANQANQIDKPPLHLTNPRSGR